MAPYNTHTYVYEIVLYIPTCLGQLCAHSVCLSHVTYSFIQCVFPRISDGALQHTDMILYIIYMCV